MCGFYAMRRKHTQELRKEISLKLASRQFLNCRLQLTRCTDGWMLCPQVSNPCRRKRRSRGTAHVEGS
jgi:hypothetical protein